MPNIETSPFEVRWPQDRRDDIRRRIADYPFPAVPAGAGWSIGCDGDLLAALRNRWLDGFDWDKAVERLNRHPQFVARIDGIDLHYAHVRAERADAPKLLMMHGWPSSPFEFWDVIDRLANPSRHGGRAEDAIELIVPSLPGYGFSGKPETIIGPRAVAGIIHRLMTEVIGADRYLAHGGDWGAVITSWLAVDQPDHVEAIHLAMITLPQPEKPETPEDEAWMARFRRVQALMGGYSHLQASKPQSLAWLAAGNPMGQAAWILERYHDWSDLRTRRFEDVYDLDWLITAILVYVMPDSFASAAYLYNGLARESGGSIATLVRDTRCETPTAFTNHLGDERVMAPPRARIEKAYNITRWVDADWGGHFPARECPDEFVADITEWLRTLR